MGIITKNPDDFSLNVMKGKNAKLIQSKVRDTNVILGKSVVEESGMFDFASAYDKSKLFRSDMTYNSKILGESSVEYSYVGGSVVVSGKAQIINSGLFNSSVITDEGFVMGSMIHGTAVISGHAIVVDSEVGGSAVVTGTAIIKDIVLVEDQYMNEGEWTRLPIHLNQHHMMNYYGLPLGITESIGDRWTIGCTTYSYDFWMRHSHMIQKATHLSYRQIQEYKWHLTRLHKIKGDYGK